MILAEFWNVPKKQLMQQQEWEEQLFALFESLFATDGQMLEK